MLIDRLHKNNITITQHTIASAGKSTVDIDFIREMEKGVRQSVTSGKTLTAWIVFLDAEYSESTSASKVLGVSYGASSMAIFETSLYGFTKPDMPSRASLETMVLSHEFGHILGLVNNGTPMVTAHQDDAHGAHCSNEQCLMYWKAEQNVNFNDLLGNDNLPTFDANCLADLRAGGGK
jgi:predicted Zn-dependent protease